MKPISRFVTSSDGELRVKISTTHQDSGAIEYDDYLQNEEKEWKSISVGTLAQSYSQIPEVVELKGQETTTVPLVKGYANDDLVVYAPQNKSVRDDLLEDTQSHF